MNRFFTATLAIVLILSASCSRIIEGGYDSITLVDDLLSDSYPALEELALQAGQSSGTIVLAGDPMRCLSLSEEMMSFDDFDNVDARKVSDGLPDFAGETIVSILDFMNYPHDSLAMSEEGRYALREAAVRTALAALDSTCRCKVLIFCSPEIAENGGDDVTDFFEQFECEVPVIYSADTAYSFSSECFKVMREKNLFTHNIAWPVAKLLISFPPSGDDPAFSLAGFDDLLVPESFADTLGVLAPNTFVSYVQNKH